MLRLCHILLLTIVILPAKKASGLVFFYEWQKLNRQESYPSICLYPIGYAVFNKKADLGLQVKIGNSVGLDLGLQSPVPFSNVALYSGARYYRKYDEIGFANTLNLTALAFNFSISHEYIGYNVLKLSVGLGVPYIWYVPNRKNRNDF